MIIKIIKVLSNIVPSSYYIFILDILKTSLTGLGTNAEDINILFLMKI